MTTLNHYFIRKKILPFKQHVMFRKAAFMWKVAHGYAPSIISQIFTTNQQNTYKFVLPHVRNEKSKLYFLSSCIKAWNCVPDSLKTTSTLSNFNLKYKKMLLDSIEPTNHTVVAHNDNSNNTNNINNNINNNNNIINTTTTNNNNPINNNQSGIQNLRRGGNNYGRLATNWTGHRLTARWDNQAQTTPSST